MSDLLESTDTNSSSLSEDSLNISFDSITLTVGRGIRHGGKRKDILKNVSGEFIAGELSCIIGPSGAGKSSLMDVVAGYTKPTSGKIFVNDTVRNEKKFRRRSCYILQDVKIQEQLTVRESMAVAAELKLGNHINCQQKVNRIEEVIKALKLDDAKDTRAVNLSGGQKKRLAIGLELISDPSVMFLDEPTSGLDCSMSNQIVRLLGELAQQGRTVVVTIHQPSAAQLEKVDRLYTVVDGQCAYMGTVPQLHPYLEQLEMKCPAYHNPVDFFIEKCDNDNLQRMVLSSENGRCINWTSSLGESSSSIANSTLQYSNNEVFLTSLPPPKENPTNKVLLALKSTYATSRWNQFTTLTRRALLSTWRDPTLLLMYSIIHLGMGVLVGTLFIGIGNEANNIMDNFKFLFYSLMFLMFTAFSTVSIRFPEQMNIVRREHFNSWYSTSAYYSSTLVSIMPMQTICTCLYVCITYWMTGQPFEVLRFTIYLSTLFMVSIVSVCVGFLNGSIFSVQYGVICGPLIIMPFVVFSGFFLRLVDAPYFFHWFFHISFIKHGFVGLVISIYGMDRQDLLCIDDGSAIILYCPFKNPKTFLKFYGMESEGMPMVYLALLVTFVLTVSASYSILRIRLKHKW